MAEIEFNPLKVSPVFNQVMTERVSKQVQLPTFSFINKTFHYGFYHG